MFFFAFANTYAFFRHPTVIITKRLGNVVTIPPRGLGSNNAFCHLDERITGGGYGSSSPGVRSKDEQ